MSATTIPSHARKIRSLRSLRKPEDVEAMNIRFGVELETKVPRTCGLAVGGYHAEYPVKSAIATNGQQLVGAAFNGTTWRADRDGSITCEANEMRCEFVSRILHGAEGVENLCRFMEWMNAIGATWTIRVTLKAVCGPRDINDLAAAITVMLVDED